MHTCQRVPNIDHGSLACHGGIDAQQKTSILICRVCSLIGRTFTSLTPSSTCVPAWFRDTRRATALLRCPALDDPTELSTPALCAGHRSPHAL
jgi:hypothetical protein